LGGGRESAISIITRIATGCTRNPVDYVQGEINGPYFIVVCVCDIQISGAADP
jgi:hypothetical protein